LFENCVKEYTGIIAFGEETDTLDPYGEVIARGEVPSLDSLETALDGFRGNILQAPPAYSAIHVNGHRAYELARSGQDPQMKKRPATVFELSLLSWTPPEAGIRVRVSAGTYVRSLARDIALAAGSRAHLSALKRTKIGPYNLEDASPAGETGESALIPLDKRLFESLSFPYFLLDPKGEENFIHGRPLEGFLPDKAALPGTERAGAYQTGAPAYPGSTLAYAGVFNAAAELLGVIKKTTEKKNDKWAYCHVFNDN
jgi:tRNA pseudouridine55 synthase